jgi:hypothetical protein
MDTAVAGDTVIVSCGTYYEHDIQVKNGVCLTSLTGTSDCVTIDAQDLGRVLVCDHVDSSTSIIGIEVFNGQMSMVGFGGGLYCNHSDPVLTNCAFRYNSADHGGGAYLADASPVFTNCEFSWNYTCDYGTGGAGVAVGSGSPEFTNCVFSHNGSNLCAGGAVHGDPDSATFNYCLFDQNEAYGSAVFVRGGSYAFRNCTFADNLGRQSAGVITYEARAHCWLENCIIAFDHKASAFSWVCADPIAPILTCCNIYGNWAGDWTGLIADQYGINGNISEDPLFCDISSGDFYLCSNSPCLDTDTCGTIGMFGLGCEFDSTSVVWSDVTVGALGEDGPGSGLGWVDYDADGDLDIYFTNRETAENVLLRNDDLTPGGFVDATPALLADPANSRGCPWGDYDGDGDTDLYLSVKGVNKLIRNDGGGTFVDVTAPPLDDSGTGQAAAWFDYDNDGDLDIYLVNNGANKLFRNDSAGGFTDVTTGPLGDAGWGMGLGLADYDGDGDLDIYVANYDHTANVLMQNQGGGVFADVTTPVLESASSSYGAAWGDYDNDGDLDLYVTNEGANSLLRNDGGTFTDVTAPPLDDDGQGRSAAWGDSDNDGDLDLYVVNYDGANRLFRNDGGGNFVKPTGCGGSELSDTGPGFSTGWADYDKDGDLDLYVVNQGANALFRNELDSGHHWLEVDPVGVISNTDGVGTRVRIVVGGICQMREIAGASGFASQGPLTAWFGLGTDTLVDTVEVTWPASGTVQTLTDVACDQTIEIVEDWLSGLVDPKPVPVVFRLHPARPNPFSGVTTIRYDLPEGAHVDLAIYDVSGRVVRRLLNNRPKQPGYHAAYWNGCNTDGQPVAPGVYFCRLSAGQHTGIERMLLLR